MQRQLKLSPDRFNIILIVACWLLMLLVANAQGEFPLNDDWNYARSVRTLTESGRLEITCWNCSTNLLQIAYGTLISKLFGFSFESLRVSSQFFGLIGVIFMYLLAERISSKKYVGLVAAFALMTNPIYFNLSSTFMTDVPFLALLMAASYFAVRAIQDGRKKTFLTTILLSVAATFVRQYGAVFLFCFLLAYCLKEKFERKIFATSIGLLGLIGGILLLFRQWLLSSGLPGCYTVWSIYLQQRLKAGVVPFASGMFEHLFIQAMYLGFFVAPLIIALLPEQLARFKKKERIFFVVCTVEMLACLLIALFFKQLSMPLTTNVLFDGGVGPVLIVGDIFPSLGRNFWNAITFLSAIGFSLCIASFAGEFVHRKQAGRAEQGSENTDNAEESARNEKIIGLVFIAFLVMYVFAITFTGLIDRYILPALPALLVILMLSAKSKRIADRVSIGFKVVPFVLLIAMSVFSVMTTHDYFSWNRARWQALNYLERDLKVPASEIDGGWEFNGWVAYESKMRPTPVVTDLTMKHGDRYVVALAPITDYRVVASWPFQRWFPPSRCVMYLLEKSR